MSAVAPGGGTAPAVCVVIVAAGRSSRMGGVDKTFAPLLGAPLIAHTVERFETHPGVGEIALVLAEESVGRGRELASSRGWRKVTQVCAGGERRQDSVYNGLAALSPCDLVMVHDGARPCLDAAMLERGIEAAIRHGAAVAGMPVKDTIKRVSPELLIEETPERARLWQAQTPQVFRYDLLLEAHRACQADVTDDAAMVESLGHPVRMFEGSYENIKVTTAGDLTIAEAFLRGMLESLPI
jgi:2-C-methyl-D-erythritol 4-phosphate cytidylyltransferase